jgi:hypothetical protein
MLDKKLASERVSRKLATMAPAGDGWIVIEDKTIEKPFGWIFFITRRSLSQLAT